MNMKAEPEELVVWDKFEVLREMDFDKLCAERARYSRMKEEAEVKLKVLNTDIASALQISGQKSVRYDKWRVTQINGRSASKLSVKLLLEQGVDPAVIADATEPGTEYTTIQMKEIKQSESGN